MMKPIGLVVLVLVVIAATVVITKHSDDIGPQTAMTVSANCSLLTHRESLNAIVAISISDGYGDDYVVLCAGNSIQFTLYSNVLVNFTLHTPT